jgi:RimJ/RimL family protein N-acetyltransferase
MLVHDKIRLRPIRLPHDILIAYPWYQDREVLYYSEGKGKNPYTRETINKMYSYLSKIGEVYIIEIMQSEEWIPIGDATLSKEMLPIVIGVKKYRSKGYGQQVLRLLIDRARKLYWSKLVVRKIFIYNTASKKLFESFGFDVIGTSVDQYGRVYESLELYLK